MTDIPQPETAELQRYITHILEASAQINAALPLLAYMLAAFPQPPPNSWTTVLRLVGEAARHLREASLLLSPARVIDAPEPGDPNYLPAPHR